LIILEPLVYTLYLHCIIGVIFCQLGCGE
jgi:hypothetical protein